MNSINRKRGETEEEDLLKFRGSLSFSSSAWSLCMSSVSEGNKNTIRGIGLESTDDDVWLEKHTCGIQWVNEWVRRRRWHANEFQSGIDIMKVWDKEWVREGTNKKQSGKESDDCFSLVSLSSRLHHPVNHDWSWRSSIRRCYFLRHFFFFPPHSITESTWHTVGKRKHRSDSRGILSMMKTLMKQRRRKPSVCLRRKRIKQEKQTRMKGQMQL